MSGNGCAASWCGGSTQACGMVVLRHSCECWVVVGLRHAGGVVIIVAGSWALSSQLGACV
jgi:hypothetical protein